MEFLLRHARSNGYGVPAFNVNNLESIQAAVEAAEEEDSPLILMGWEGDLEYAGSEYFSALALAGAKKARVPVAIHLDHGSTFEWCMEAIRWGFTSVMIDASPLPFEQNVAVTRKVVEVGHAAGATVEAELGHIETGDVILTDEQLAKNMTDPDEAVRFVEETGVDALAVAVGNAHGLYKYEPKLDFGRLETIVNKVNCFVVMHGGSGTPGLPKAIQLGVTKVNIGTDIAVAFRESVNRTLKDKPLEGLYQDAILNPATEAMKQVMKGRMQEFGSSGQGQKCLRGG
jgi:fructose-bisphosphate aldolase class II